MAALAGRGDPLGGPSPSRPPWERPLVASLNGCLTCPLCRGYLVDAMTLVKCLHSFCKSCILKHLETGSSCPVCELRLSKINMEVQLRKDEILQNIVYKAIPGLYQKEMKRRRDFYSSRGGKDEHAALTPEEKGELDNSSSGRVIFSPDEAVSLSLEYKHVVSSRLEGGDSTPGTCNPAFKEPVKRYLNCPAAVTIALLQKFLRMKYGISSKYKVDIYYLDDILWSKYTLMDIAYIYCWKRDVPLQLFYRISENISRPTGPFPTGVAVTTAPGLAEGSAREGAPQQQTQQQEQQGPLRGDSSRGPAFLKDSVSFPGGSRSCKDAGTKPEPAESTTQTLTIKEAPDAKPTSSDNTRERAEPKVQSKADVAPTLTPAASKSVPDRKVLTVASKTTAKVKTSAPVQAKNVTKPVPENRRQMAKAKPHCDQLCTVPNPPVHSVRPASTEKSVSTSATVPTDFSGAAVGRPTTVPAEMEKDKASVAPLRLKVPVDCLKPAKASVDVPVMELSQIAAKTSSQVSKREMVSQAGSASTPCTVEEGTSIMTNHLPLPGSLPNGAAKDLLKVLPQKLKTEGVHLSLDPRSKKESLEGATVLESRVELKLPNHTVPPTIEEVVKAVTLASEPANQAPVAAKPISEPVKLQTCFSRAADKAKAKMKALEAAASLKETSKVAAAVKDANEVVGLSVTLRANRQGGKGQLEDSVEKPAQKPAPVLVSPLPAPASEKSRNVPAPETLSTTTLAAAANVPVAPVAPVATAVPTYMTLSKSHPSLFHSSPRKRGRPRLATVNSLNEEIERAHMMAKRQQAGAEKPKPAIPVITSLRIKPIPPPPEATPPPVEKIRSPTTIEVQESERHKRRGSQSEVSEEKSDAEDSSGRRKSRRRRTPGEPKNTVTQPKELTLGKEQRAAASAAATQEPLRNLSGGPLSPTPAAAMPEKIMLRVTRDEKSILKVEKQLRPAAVAVVTETLHDSGFCEDVVAEGSRSPALEARPKVNVAPAPKAVQQPTLREKEPPVPSLCREPEAAARPGSNKKDMRKSKRRSVEDWVNEQSKWVRTHKAEAVASSTDRVPSPKAAKDVNERLRQQPSSSPSLVEPPPPKGQQRRGRKRTNPVKITKPDSVVDAQQEKAAGGSPPLTCRAPEKKGAAATTPPTVERPEPLEVLARCPGTGNSPRESSKSRREPESPKKTSELVIPRYIPNPATSIPLTITHARNKRLRETDKLSEACLDLSTHSGDSRADGQGKDSEKSKFFKEALNLSMKETGNGKGVQNQTFPAGKAASSKPMNLREGPAMVSSSPPPSRPLPSTSPKKVTRPNDSLGQRDGAASQMNILRVVEKIASQNSRRTREDLVKSMVKERTGVTDTKKTTQAEKSLPTGTVDLSRHRNRPASKADRVPTIPQDRIPMLPVEKDPSIQAHSVTSTKRLSISTATSTSEPRPKSAEPLTPSCLSPSEGNSAEIIPRINQTGVFRLEFPGADVPEDKPSSPASVIADTAQEAELLNADVDQQKQQGVKALCAPDCAVSESVKNIARIQESIMGLQRQSTVRPVRRSEENHKDEALLSCSVNGERLSPPSEDMSGTPDKLEKDAVKAPSCAASMKIDDTRTSKAEHGAAASLPSDSKDLPRVSGEKVKTCNKEDPHCPVVAQRTSQSPGLRTEEKPNKSASTSRSPAQTAAPLKTGIIHPSRSLEMLTQRLRMDLERMRKEKSQIKFGSSGCQKMPEPRTQKHLDIPNMARNRNTEECTPCGRALMLPGAGGNEKQLSMETIPQQLVYNSVVGDRSCEAPIQHLPKTHQKIVQLQMVQSGTSPALADSFTKCSKDSLMQSRSLEVAESRTSSNKDFKSELSILSLPDVAREDSLQSPDTSSETKLPSSSSRSLALRDFTHKGLLSASACTENPSRPTSAPLQVFSSPFVERDDPQRSYSEESSSKPLASKTFEQSCMSPQTSEDSLDVKPRERCKSEGQSISSSNEVSRSEASGSKETSAIPSPKASEHMYRTTVAEIDLFTTLTIIDTMKGRATVYDIIDDYITNLSSFFSTLEASPEATRVPLEEAFRSKRTVLVKLVELLKKLTSSLSSSQLNRVLALETLVERFLVQSASDKECEATTVASEASVSDVPHCCVERDSTACGGTVLVAPQTSFPEGLEEPPLVSIPELEIPIVPILQREFSFCASRRKKGVKRLRKCGWSTAGLLQLGRKPMGRLALPEAAICRRFLSGWRSPALVGGSFNAVQPRPSSSFCVPLPVLDACGPTQGLVALCRRSLEVPQLSAMVDALSFLLTGSYFHLVNRTPPTNGQHRMSPIPVTLLPTETFSNVLSTFHRQNLVAPNLQDTLLSVLSRLLCGHQHHESGPSQHQQLQQSLMPFQNRRNDLLARPAQTGTPGLILVHAAADSSLVISSPQSNSKLVISADLNQQLLTGLMNRLSSVPKTSASVQHWLNNLASVASVARRGHRMLAAAACHFEAPDQRICGTSRNSVELRPAAVDTVAMSRRFLRKRRVADCKASLAPKRRRTEDRGFAKDNSAGCSWRNREGGTSVAGADSCPTPVVPKGCIVLLQRLNLSDIEGVTLKRKLRCRAARGSPKKKPKLSDFPAALPGTSR
ncbi:unnamed protein product [Ixodes hexagonus]